MITKSHKVTTPGSGWNKMRLDQDCILGILSSTPPPSPTKKSKLDFGSGQFTLPGHKHPPWSQICTLNSNTYPHLNLNHGRKHLPWSQMPTWSPLHMWSPFYTWSEMPTLVSNIYPGLKYLPGLKCLLGLYYTCGLKYLPWFQTLTLVSNTYLVSNVYPGLKHRTWSQIPTMIFNLIFNFRGCKLLRPMFVVRTLW